MKLTDFKKAVSVVATLALLVNSLITPFAVLAQEELPTPTQTPVETPVEEATPSPEATVEPTIAPTTEPVIEPTVEPTPTQTPVETSTPSAEPTIIETPTDNSAQVATSEPTTEPTSTPTTKPAIVEIGSITTTIVENVDLSNIVLLNSNVDAPSVVTDKADYSPTSIVFVTGTNFSKEKEYTIEISSTDEPPVVHSNTVTTDQDGSFAYSYQLDGNYRPNYKIEVKNGEVLVASTTFTDSDTGFFAPNQTITNNSVGNPNNGWTSDNNRATFDSQSDSVDYGFPSFGIPAGATIDGIAVMVEGRRNPDRDLSIAIWNTTGNPDAFTSTKTATLSNSNNDNTTTLGSPTDKWGKTWSVSDFADATFKIQVHAISSGPGDVAELDHVQVKVYYTLSDTTPPVITVNNPTSAPAQSKTITASTNEGALTMSNTLGSVCNGSLTFVAYASQTFSNEADNGKKVCYKAVDTAGNTTYLMSSPISGIDKTPPVITVAPYLLSWTNQDIVVNASVNEGSLNSNSHTFTTNSAFTFVGTDLAGNSSSQIVTITNIDKVLPTVLATVSGGVMGLNDWYKSDVTIHFTCADTDSGIVSCPADQVLSTEGGSITSVSQTTTDNAGNVSNSSNTVTVKIDKTAPVASVGYDISTPTSGNVIATISPSEPVTVTNNGGLISHTFTNNGSFTFEFVDQAGNTGSATATVSNIDRVAPVITIDPYNLSLTNQDITVNATVNEGLLDFTSHTFTTNGSFTFNAVDLAGNSSSQTVTITNIDKVVPVLINQSFFGSTWYDGWMESIFSYWDENGIASGDNPSCMVTTEGANQTCSLTPNVIDNAGNVNNTPVTSNTVNIDMSNPTGSWVNPVANSTVSGIVTLDFDAQDSASGVKSVEFSYKRNDGVDTFHALTSNSWDTTDLELDTYILRATVTDNIDNSITVDEVVGVSAIISNETAVTLGTDSVGISWTTNKPTTSRVIYDNISHGTLTDEAPNYGYAYSTDTYNGDKVLNHYITISNLPSGSNFFYRTVSTGSPMVIGSESYFRTYSISGAPASNNSTNATASILGTTSGPARFVYQENENSSEQTQEVKVEEKTEGSKATETNTNGDVLGAQTQTSNVMKWILLPIGVLILIFVIFKLSRRSK